MVATILPSIVQELRIPFTRLHDAAWIVTGYLLGYTVALPVVGRLADIHGRRRLFLGSLALFAAASVICALARSLELLVAARALQAVGGGALLPLTLAEVGRRGVLIGVVSAVAEVGGVLGPLYGALLVSVASWPWVFWLNLPLAAACAAVLGRQRTERTEPANPEPSAFDWRGALLLTAALAGVTVALSRERGEVNAGLLAIGVILFAAFAALQLRVHSPLVDLAPFRNRAYAASMALNACVGAALIVAMVNVPLWSATVRASDAAAGGWLLLRLTVPLAIGGLLGGLALRRVEPEFVSLAGLAAAAAGFWLMSGWSSAVDDATMTLHLALAGLGFGLLLAPVAATAIAWAGDDRETEAASLVVVARMVGMMLGLSGLTSYGLGRFDSLVAGLQLPLPRAGEAAAAVAARQAEYASAVTTATVQVFDELWFAAALICAVGVIPALLLRSRQL